MHEIQSEAEFQEWVAEHDPLLVYFTNDVCVVGESLLSKVEQLVADEGVQGVVVNTVRTPAISGQNLVLTVPAILVFRDGKEYTRLSRNVSLAEVEDALYRARQR